MNLYDQQENETPFEWVHRVVRTVAFRLIYAVMFLFVLGYLIGSVK